VSIGKLHRLSEGATEHSLGSISQINRHHIVAAFQEHKKRFGYHSHEYVPLLLDDHTLLSLDKDATVFDKGILDAVTRGVGIQLTDSGKEEGGVWVDITNIQSNTDNESNQ